jgi:hypothetical protein
MDFDPDVQILLEIGTETNEDTTKQINSEKLTKNKYFPHGNYPSYYGYVFDSISLVNP